MNAYQKVIQALGLNTDSQGDNGWLYSLLMLGSYDYEGSDTHANAAREVVRRFEAANIGPHSLARVKAMLNTLEQKLDR